MAFVSFGLDCPHYPLSQRHALGAWLITLNLLLLSTNIPWDFDHSESETEMNVTCRNHTHRNPNTENLREALQPHSGANVSQPETVVSKVVFFELSHTLPSCNSDGS